MKLFSNTSSYALNLKCTSCHGNNSILSHLHLVNASSARIICNFHESRFIPLICKWKATFSYIITLGGVEHATLHHTGEVCALPHPGQWSWCAGAVGRVRPDREQTSVLRTWHEEMSAAFSLAYAPPLALTPEIYRWSDGSRTQQRASSCSSLMTCSPFSAGYPSPGTK